MQPAKELGAPEGLLPQLYHPFFQFFRIHGPDIRLFHPVFPHALSPSVLLLFSSEAGDKKSIAAMYPRKKLDPSPGGILSPQFRAKIRIQTLRHKGVLLQKPADIFLI